MVGSQPGSTTSESLGSGIRHEYVKNKQTLQMTYVLSHIVGREPLIYFTERVSEPNEVAWSLHLVYSGCYAINRVPPKYVEVLTPLIPERDLI